MPTGLPDTGAWIDATDTGTAGAGDVDSAIGSAAIETSTEAIRNSCRPMGSYRRFII